MNTGTSGAKRALHTLPLAILSALVCQWTFLKDGRPDWGVSNFYLFGFLGASVLSLILFIPAMNVSAFPLVAVVFGFAFVLINFVYGYLSQRIGLFAAWTCQITVNLLLLWVSRLIG